MIYTPGAHDARVLSFSRIVIRDALQTLRESEQIARQQRARDRLTSVRTDADAAAGRAAADDERSP